jgi:predicted enzyme related to lactoylglutathione lyase
MHPTETFFALPVADMSRATAFYAAAFSAEVRFASPGWSSLFVAGVRIGVFPTGDDRREASGALHFAVDDLAAALADVVRAGGRVVAGAAEVAPGVTVAIAADTEGNVFTLRGPHQ